MNPNMYNTYDNEHFEYEFPFSFDKANKEYLKKKNVPDYEWDYEDTIIIPFDIAPCYWRYQMLLTVVNFRGEPVYQQTSYVDECGKIYLDIDVELSAKIFIKGMYYCKIQAQTEKDIVGVKPAKYTILPGKACQLYVR